MNLQYYIEFKVCICICIAQGRVTLYQVYIKKCSFDLWFKNLLLLCWYRTDVTLHYNVVHLCEGTLPLRFPSLSWISSNVNSSYRTACSLQEFFNLHNALGQKLTYLYSSLGLVSVGSVRVKHLKYKSSKYTFHFFFYIIYYTSTWNTGYKKPSQQY